MGKPVRAAMYCAWMAMMLGSAACTLGQVTDATSGASIAGATLHFDHVDTSTTEGFSTTPVAFTGTTQHVTSGAPVPSATIFNYWLDPYAPRNPGDTTNTFVGPGWIRVTVSAPGHATSRVYRNHQYSDDQVQTNVPYSGGPYPVPSTWNVQSGLAAIEDFRLYPTAAHPLWPDLIVDVRSIAAHQIGVVFPGRLFCPSNKCLVFGLNIANVSPGPFELRSHTGSPSTITQVITQSSGPAVNFAISGGLMLAPPGEGWHVSHLARITLRGPIASGSCNTEATASACPAVISSFKDICLEGTGGPFDSVYGGSFAQQAPLNCWPNGSAGNPFGALHTGLAPGFAEFYSIGNSENILDVASLASGTYWLEAEVNPNGTYHEADRSNNLARVQVSL